MTSMDLASEQAPNGEGEAATGRVVGKAVVRPLKNVRPNDWNPNVMSPAQMESLRHGFRTDGWIASEALLIWGTDETGARKDVIIDGEHKWTAARDVGIESGPMVFLNGLTEAAAKQLTVKMNQKRGTWDPGKLEDLLKDLAAGGAELSAIDLGFGEEALMSLLAIPVVDPPAADPTPAGVGGEPSPGGLAAGTSGAPEANGAAGGTPPTGAIPEPPTAQTRMVQLYLDSISQPKFLDNCQALAAAWGTKTITDTVLEAVGRARAALPSA
jgi:hypothetical protein